MQLIKDFLTNELHLAEDMLSIAEPMAEILGKVDQQKLEALKTALLQSEDIPPDFLARGLFRTGVYLSAMGYVFTQEVLLKACKSIQ